MLKLSVVTCFSAALTLALALPPPSSDYLSKIKVFYFTINDKVVNFEYTMDNGKKFTGTAMPLNEYSNVYMMMGPDDTFYWVRFDEDDIKKDSFYKAVYFAQIDRENEKIAHLMNDYERYDIYKSGYVYGGFYEPEWDEQNVAFKLADNTAKTFSYVIYSLNNGREVRGITSYINDPHLQIVLVPDRHVCYLFQATFTDDELNSNETIYKPLEQSKVCDVTLPAHAPVPPSQIDPSLLKSLIGSIG